MPNMLLEADPIAVWSLVVAIIGVAIGLVAAIAAIYAAVYAKAAPTKEDLARVEGNTAHLEDVRDRITNIDARSKRQMERDELISKANRVSLCVRGDDIGTQPLVVHLALKDPSVSLTHIELINDAESVFGFAPCKALGELEYVASIDPKAVWMWFNGGVAVQHTTRVRLNLRVFMLMEGQEVYRSMAVILNSVQKPTPNGSQAGWIVEGDV